MSCIPPNLYAQRFNSFMNEILFFDGSKRKESLNLIETSEVKLIGEDDFGL